ncbi:putative mannose-specific lectin [Mycobacteroides abscessus subsp. massiliense]|nr:putative mannose-specific lectin [Mycobacteroides abscessus subsp. massiliense]
MQDDGNLVLTEGGSPIWASDTSGHSAGRAEVQSDGNFVVYDNGGGALWSSNTEGRSDVKLVLQDDRNLVLYSGADSVWSSGTHASGIANPDLIQPGQVLTIPE